MSMFRRAMEYLGLGADEAYGDSDQSMRTRRPAGGRQPMRNTRFGNVDDDVDDDVDQQSLEYVISNTLFDPQSATIQDQVILNKLSQQLFDLKIENLNQQFLKKIKYEIEEHGDYFAYNMKFNKNNKKYAQSPLISFNKLAFLLHLFYTFVLN